MISHFYSCLWILASSAAVSKKLPISIFAKGRLHVPHLRINSAGTVSYSKEKWSGWLVHFFRSVASEQHVKMDRTPLCVCGVCFWRERTSMAIFLAFTCLGAPLIQPKKHFAACSCCFAYFWPVLRPLDNKTRSRYGSLRRSY